MVTAPPRRLARMPRLRVATPAPRAPTALVALGLAAAVAYAAFADGAIELPNEARLQVGVAALALLALAAWAFPGVHVGGLIDLDQTAFFSRLRAPLAYWNALALFRVLAVPIALRAAAARERSLLQRRAALLALIALLVTIALTYSRSGIAVL